MTEAEKAYQYFVIAVPENEEQAKAYFWARKALQSTLTQPNEPLTLEELSLCNDPVWIRRIGDGDLSDDGWADLSDEGWAIVEGPRCLTWHDGIPVSWGIRVWWPGSEDEDCPKYENYGKTWLAYRRPPEGEEET